MIKLDETYWQSRWENAETRWDIGYPSTPLVEYFDQLENKDLKILIPGCGNAYEGEYLIKKGFKNVYLMDIAPLAIKNIQKRFPAIPNESLLLGDFFEHQNTYDLIVEQTFF